MAIVHRAPLPPRQFPSNPDEWTVEDAAAAEAFYAREEQVRSFKSFAKAFWHLAEPRERCIWTKHLDAICDEAQAVWEESEKRRTAYVFIMDAYGWDAEAAQSALDRTFGDVQPLRLVILVPPRHSKSTLMRLLAAWVWIRRAGTQVLYLTAVDTLIETNGVLLRDMFRSEQYRQLQQHLIATKRATQGDPERGVPEGAVFALRADTYAKEKLQNTAEGTWEGHVLGGRFTGVNSDLTVIDDPHDVDDGLNEASSAASKSRVMADIRSVYKSKVEDRFNSPIFGICILVMQRVHPEDLADYMISQGAMVVCLPARYNPSHPHRYTKDWRTEPGELLCPQRFTNAWHVREQAKDPHGYATKQDLLPTAKEGTKFKRAWFKNRFADDVHAVARACDEVVLSVDCASKTGDRNDFTSMGVWGRRGALRFLLDRRYFKGEIGAVLQAFDELVREWPEATLKLVEDKSAGTQLIQFRRDIVPGIVPINPSGDKDARANYAQAAYEAGNVWLPANVPDKDTRVLKPNPWLNEYVENMVAFGSGAHDDDVDMTSQVFKRWAEGMRPWLTPEQRTQVGQVAIGLATSDNVIRWARRESGRTYFLGVVPGWANGLSPAVAAFVDGRGRLVAMVEVNDGGVDRFVSDLALEALTWTPMSGRYAEVDGMPFTETVRGLQARRVRVAGDPSKWAGDKGAGYRATRDEQARLWAKFLEAVGQGRAVVPDGRTMAALESVVESNGIPRAPDGQPIGGRALAYLLAMQAMMAAPADAQDPNPFDYRYRAPEQSDMWGPAAAFARR